MKRRKFIKVSSRGTIILGALSVRNALPFISVTVPKNLRKLDTVRLFDMIYWPIIVHKEAIPSERYAAEEFQRLFKAVTDVELQIKNQTEDKNGVFIGSSAILAQGAQNTLSDFGEEGLHINIDKNVVWITGGRPRGILYGVYEFFERYIGVRFLTHDHTFIPADASTVLIPVADFYYKPHFSFRWSFYQENYDNPEFATCLRVNTITDSDRLGGKTSQELINHSISKFLPVSVYGKKHPEYFALVNGVRKLEAGGGGPQVCSLNANVIRIITEAVLQELNANPSLKGISVSQMDNNFVCECPVCSALIAKEESQGAPHLALVNAVAKSIAVSHPGIKVGTLIYWYSRKPPKNMTLLPNVQIMLCSIECCTLHPLDDATCSRNKLFCEDLHKWRKICKSILIWNYDTNFTAYDLPFPNFNVIAKNVQLFRDNNAEGVFMEAAGNGLSTEMSDLRNYVMSRCLWQPTFESWQLVDEFCRLHYGKAAPPILAYLIFLHKNAELRGVHPNCFPRPAEAGLDFKISQQIYSYFLEARKLALDDKLIQLRVEKATIPALKALLETAPRGYQHGLYKYDTSLIDEEIFNQYTILTKKFSMERASDEKLTQTYLDELQTLKRGVPAAILENDIWRIVLLPEQKGRFVQILHKPTNNSLVNSPGAGDIGISSSKLTDNSWKQDGNSLIVSRRFKDGSIWVRKITLPFQKEEIRIEAQYTAGQQKSGWKFVESPCLFKTSASEDPKIISVFTKDIKWKWSNRDWEFDREIIFHHLLKAGTYCSSYAFYDALKKFGIKQEFDPGIFSRFFLFWHPGRKELRMEMCLPENSIQKGQKISFSYGIHYLEQPPVEFGKVLR